MFIPGQNTNELERYINLLSSIGSLSNLFSESNVPYLYYRVAENAFCRAFEADNYSRSDTSADAGKNSLGFGLKTFLNGNGKTYQKVAEFNKQREEYALLLNNPEELVRRVSQLRNTRIDFAKETHDLKDLIYHCVVREEAKFVLFEEPMDYVQIDKIKKIESKKNSISFQDGINEYTFNLSKSTLLKRFVTQRQYEFPIEILEDPFELIENLWLNQKITDDFELAKNKESLVLPLYSPKTKEVQEKSGLDQCNAGGRKRHPDEVYIPIPSWIHKEFKDFFPPRDKPFNLVLPSKKEISAKVCQDNSKALMSNPNQDLGKWLLRKLLRLKEWELLTYKKLEEIGIDSVEITKIDGENFEINFIPLP
jgi:hypothetical protein